MDSVSGSAIFDSYDRDAVTIAEATPMPSIPMIKVRFNGLSMWEFWSKYIYNATSPVPVKVEVTFDEVLDRFVHRVIVSGFVYRTGTREKVEAGGKIGEEDRGVCFLHGTQRSSPMSLTRSHF